MAARDLLSGIFVADPPTRLSIAEIRGHSFFQGVFWDDLPTSFRFERIKIQR